MKEYLITLEGTKSPMHTIHHVIVVSFDDAAIAAKLLAADEGGAEILSIVFKQNAK